MRFSVQCAYFFMPGDVILGTVGEIAEGAGKLSIASVTLLMALQCLLGTVFLTALETLVASLASVVLHVSLQSISVIMKKKTQYQ